MSDATANQQRIALLGVPIEIGASQAGTLMGPAALRTAGIARLLEELEFTVEDHGDLARPNVVADAKIFHKSYGDQNGELWAPSGRLLATTTQIAYFKA